MTATLRFALLAIAAILSVIAFWVPIPWQAPVLMIAGALLIPA